jgi:hypothetical protein
MKALSSITNEELVDIFKRYFVNLFNPEKSLCFVSCNPSKSDDIQSFFKDLKYEVEVEEVSVSDKDGEVDDEDDQDADSATDSDEGCDGDSDEDSNEDSDEEQ